MERRRFLQGSVALLAAPFAAEAQPTGKVWRIGYVGGTSDGIRGARSDAFIKGLREAGFTVGQNVTIDYRWLGDRLSPAPEVVADFVRTNVDVIVAAGSAAVFSAKGATTTIPIVMIGPRDPVEQGLVASLARPGGNITGVSSTAAPAPGMAFGRSLALITEAMPQVSRVGYLWSSKFPGAKPTADEVLRVAKTLRITVRPFDLAAPEDASTAFAAMKRDSIEAVLVEAALTSYRKTIIALAATSRLPAFYGNSLFTEEGGLISSSPDWVEIFWKGGRYTGQILNGAKPADLPVEQPTRFEVVVNLKTAKALGFTVPPSLLLRATRIIE